jgi:hypothetical protein
MIQSEEQLRMHHRVISGNLRFRCDILCDISYIFFPVARAAERETRSEHPLSLHSLAVSIVVCGLLLQTELNAIRNFSKSLRTSIMHERWERVPTQSRRKEHLDPLTELEE